MKKTPIILLTLLLSLALAACGAPSAAAPSSAQPSDAVVTFADPVLEAMIRGTLGLPEGDITLSEVQSVTRIDFSNELQPYLAEQTAITDLAGLENFTNLESLDLSAQAVTDLSPLAGLTKLTTLSLAGNPVSDVSPLSGLTNLQLLILSGSQAQDYSVLAGLVNLRVLKLDDSTIADLSPLAGLANLQQLYLANSSVEDYSPLENIYANLETKDFSIASTLVDLGFQRDDGRHQAYFDSEGVSFAINHEAWGIPENDWETNLIRISMDLESGYKIFVGYYGTHKVYLCQMDKEGEQQINYIYDPAEGSNNIEPALRSAVEQSIRAAMPVNDGEDVLFAPARLLNDTLKKTFGMTADKLFALPYAPPTLKNLGFYADQANAVYLYEYRSGNILEDVNMEVHRPEWGEKEFDVRFFTPLSEEYRVVITWHKAERKFKVAADDNNQGGARFIYSVDTGEFLDEWCSDNNLTVEEYFLKAYNDPAVTDIHQNTIDLMTNFISDTFGMTVEELYALPTGE